MRGTGGVEVDRRPRVDLLVEAGVGKRAGVGGGDPGDAAREREGGDE